MNSSTQPSEDTKGYTTSMPSLPPAEEWELADGSIGYFYSAHHIIHYQLEAHIRGLDREHRKMGTSMWGNGGKKTVPTKG